jgi:hypothetical protein
MRSVSLQPNRIASLTVTFLGICTFIVSSTKFYDTQTVHKVKDGVQPAANNICNNNQPLFGKTSICDSFLRLYEHILHPVLSPTYKDASGRIFEIKEDAPWWHEPLRKEGLIVDIDTRVPGGPHELWK